jgi:hypothetical protein
MSEENWVDIKLINPNFTMRVALHKGRWCGEVYEGAAPRPVSTLTTISHNEMVRWAKYWGLDDKHGESVKTLLLIQDDLDPSTMRHVKPSRTTLG